MEEHTGVSASASAPSSEDFVALDLSKYPLDHHLLHGALAGEDKLESYTLSVSRDRQRLRATARMGHQVCGHPRIVHGGAIASLLDDTFGTLFLSSGLNGFTANLNVNYRKPLPAGTNVFIDVSFDNVLEARSGAKKVTLKGVVRDATAPDVVYTEATALFIGKTVPTSAALAESLSHASRSALQAEQPAQLDAKAAAM